MIFLHSEEEVIAQSLSLKSMLADGNMIPNNFFPDSDTPEGIANIENKRRLKRETGLLEKHYLFQFKQLDRLRDVSDQGQQLWLNLVARAHRDSMGRLTDWRRLSENMKAGEVLTEFVRFNQVLGDSSARYGALIIEAGKEISARLLFSENELKKLVTDPSASPRERPDRSRRSTGIRQKEKEGETSSKQWKSGDPDRMANLVLDGLTGFLKGKTHWHIVQDGLLNRISFSALQLEGQHLFQKFQLQQYSSTASFLAAGKKDSRIEKILVAGGLDYGTGESKTGDRVLKDGLKLGIPASYKTGSGKDHDARQGFKY